MSSNIPPVQALQHRIEECRKGIESAERHELPTWPDEFLLLAALELALADAQLVEHNNTCPIESGDCELLHDMQDSLGRCRAKLYEALQR